MVARRAISDYRLGVNLIVSAVMHLVVFLLAFQMYSQRYSASFQVRETYYVDVVNLPVASPRLGSPTQKGDDAEAPSLPSREQSMVEPPPTKPATISKPDASQKTLKNDTTKADSDVFEKKMAALQGKADSRRQEAAFERLRSRVGAAGSGRSGMPDGTGSEAGGRYEDYIKSRLEDALKRTSSYETRKPEVVIRLTISKDGRIIRRKTERSTGDRVFEIAVQRAIEIAEANLVPPPDRKTFESGFIFKPQEISNSKN